MRQRAQKKTQKDRRRRFPTNPIVGIVEALQNCRTGVLARIYLSSEPCRFNNLASDFVNDLRKLGPTMYPQSGPMVSHWSYTMAWSKLLAGWMGPCEKIKKPDICKIKACFGQFSHLIPLWHNHNYMTSFTSTYHPWSSASENSRLSKRS